MFWGVAIESGKRYVQVVHTPFKITNAALEATDQIGTNKFVSVMLEHGKMEYLLCTLEHGKKA